MTALDDAKLALAAAGRTQSEANASVAAAQRVVDALSVTPPPPSIVFGHCKVINHNDLAYSQREYAEMVASNGKCPRVDYWQNGAQGVTVPAAKAAGFPHLLLCLGATMRTVPDPAVYAALVVKAAAENPAAFIEYANEPGINGWTPADCVRVWNAATKALRDNGHANVTLMGAIAGPERASLGRAGPRQWCRELRAAGFKIGVTCDLPNFHVYGDLVVQEQNWLNYWTPYNGESCVSVLGTSEFALTEFNFPVGNAVGATLAEKEANAALKLTKNIGILKAMPGCRLATLYALSDDAKGTSTGYGLAVPAEGWRRRASFDAFRQATA